MRNNLIVDDDQTTGARLRSERERLGLPYYELAHRGGCVDVIQKHYEAGRKPIPVGYLQRLHAHTEVDVWFVLTGTPGSAAHASEKLPAE